MPKTRGQYQYYIISVLLLGFFSACGPEESSSPTPAGQETTEENAALTGNGSSKDSQKTQPELEGQQPQNSERLDKDVSPQDPSRPAEVGTRPATGTRSPLGFTFLVTDDRESVYFYYAENNPEDNDFFFRLYPGECLSVSPFQLEGLLVYATKQTGGGGSYYMPAWIVMNPETKRGLCTVAQRCLPGHYHIADDDNFITFLDTFILHPQESPAENCVPIVEWMQKNKEKRPS